MKVVVVNAESYSPDEIWRAFKALMAELGGLEKFIAPGERILVKPNLLEGLSPDRAVTTHPEVLRAVIRAIKNAGAIPVVGDSPGTCNTRKVAERCDVLQVCNDEDVELLSFEETRDIHLPEGLLIRRFRVARQILEVDKVISLAKMKTHTFMGVTGATKNLFGCIVGMQKAQFHLRMQARSEFAAMLIDLAAAIRPVLSIIDGVVAMEGNGPRNGQPIAANMLIAGSNSLAVDMIMAECMGFTPEDIPVLAIALERGLLPRRAAITVVDGRQGGRLIFKAPHTLRTLEERIPKWLIRFGRSQLTAQPQVNAACIRCGCCVQHCPPQAMRLSKNYVKIDQERCIRCYCCQEFCPANAITIKDGTLMRFLQQFI